MVEGLCPSLVQLCGAEGRFGGYGRDDRPLRHRPYGAGAIAAVALLRWALPPSVRAMFAISHVQQKSHGASSDRVRRLPLKAAGRQSPMSFRGSVLE